MEIFIVRFMVSPHHKNNLEPLGPQSPQRFAMGMTFSLLFSVVKLGPLTVPKRAKRKPVHRVAQVLVTGKTKLYDPTLTAGFSDGHCSRLGLKMTRGLPATLGIAELGPDRRHQRSAFSARQRLGQRSVRARGEKTLDLVVIDLHRFDRSSKLLDEHLEQLRLGSDHMFGDHKLRFLKLLPQLLTALFTERMLLGGKAIELLTFKGTEMSRCRVLLEKIQGDLSLQILKGLQGPRIILFERVSELIEQPRFVPHHSVLISSQHFKLLGFLRARSQHSQVRLIGSQKLRQHIGIKRIALRIAHPIAIPHPIQCLGIDRVNLHPVIEQKVHDAPLRLLNGCPQLNPLGSSLVEPAPDLCPSLRALLHFHFSDLLPFLIAYVHLVRAIAPIHSHVVSFHYLLLLHDVIPIPRALNGKLALYRSSKRGQLSIEPSAPFSYWTGQSLPDPRWRGLGRVGPHSSKLLKSVSHKHELLYVNLQQC